LKNTSSPYLLQHADNPVDWFPWGEEAFQKAKNEDKPVFLSIGYSTCHWCHVMARESFSDSEVADLLNRFFFFLKVDREERPDVDQVYMNVCQALTGRGGWPLSVFMTPGKKPFFAGTYFPKKARMGMPGFLDLLKTVAEAWSSQRPRLEDSGNQITEAINATAESSGSLPGKDLLEAGFRLLKPHYDSRWGGFGPAPKFPSPHNLMFLLRRHSRTGNKEALAMVENTLRAMRSGGIYAQLGFGFHRYSVDERWHVPHFEKMLYDQALLLMAYVEAFQVTGKDVYRRVVEELSSYVLRDLTSPEGAFYSAEDADSEGEEGKFYTWKRSEVHKHLGSEEGDLFCRRFDITGPGNFERGLSIPRLGEDLESMAEELGITLSTLEGRLEKARRSLLKEREWRKRPLRDDKIIAGWNGLMIAALARASRVLRNPGMLEAARKCADFVLESMRKEGRLYRSRRGNELGVPGFLEDYAFVVWGLIELYEAGLEAGYLREAVALTEGMIDLFSDSSGLYNFSGHDSEALISRVKDLHDGATPSGNSVAAMNLLRLARMTGKLGFNAEAEKILKPASAQALANPAGFAYLMSAVDFYLGPTGEIVVSGESEDPVTQKMIRRIQQAFLPNTVILFRSQDESTPEIDRVSDFTGRLETVPGEPAVFWCEGFTCRKPITELRELEQVISEATRLSPGE